jgi:hypothetical protein
VVSEAKSAAAAANCDSGRSRCSRSPAVGVMQGVIMNFIDSRLRACRKALIASSNCGWAVWSFQ